MSLFKKFKEFFFKPDKDDHYIIEKWKKEVDEADRLKELHRKSRKQSKNTLPPDAPERSVQKAKGLIKKIEKNKNKTLSSNF